MENPFLQSAPEHVPEEKLFEGPCIGGPLDAVTMTCRFSKGFLLVDKPNNHCWIYDRKGDCFEVRNEAPMELDLSKRLRAAEEFDYDVIAAPWGGDDGNSGP